MGNTGETGSLKVREGEAWVLTAEIGNQRGPGESPRGGYRAGGPEGEVGGPEGEVAVRVALSHSALHSRN